MGFDEESDNIREARIVASSNVVHCENCSAYVCNLMAFCTACGFKNHGFDGKVFRMATSITYEEALEKCAQDPRWHRVDETGARKFCSHCGGDLRTFQEKDRDIDELLASLL
jgi:hypothetical protein